MIYIPAAYGKHKDGIARAQTAAAEPVGITVVPPIVINPRCELRNIVARRIALDPSNFAEVIHGMTRVPRTAADSEEKYSAMVCANFRQHINDAIDGSGI
jgi:hypothetical protein